MTCCSTDVSTPQAQSERCGRAAGSLNNTLHEEDKKLLVKRRAPKQSYVGWQVVDWKNVPAEELDRTLEEYAKFFARHCLRLASMRDRLSDRDWRLLLWEEPALLHYASKYPTFGPESQPSDFAHCPAAAALLKERQAAWLLGAAYLVRLHKFEQLKISCEALEWQLRGLGGIKKGAGSCGRDSGLKFFNRLLVASPYYFQRDRWIRAFSVKPTAAEFHPLWEQFPIWIIASPVPVILPPSSSNDKAR